MMLCTQEAGPGFQPYCPACYFLLEINKAHVVIPHHPTSEPREIRSDLQLVEPVILDQLATRLTDLPLERRRLMVVHYPRINPV